MIEGVVNAAYEAVVTLPLRGPDGQVREVDSVIDTGYSGFLTLAPVLGLSFVGIGHAYPANDAEVEFDVYDVTVICETLRPMSRAALSWWARCSWTGMT